MEQKTKDLMNKAADTAAELFNGERVLTPMWMIEARSGEMIIVASPFEGTESKEAIATVMRNIMKEHDAVRYVFVAESWMLEGPNLPKSVKLGGSLQSHPERMEAIAVSGEDRSGTGLMTMRILRPEHGKPTLMPRKLTEYENKGRFAKLLP